MIWAITIAVFLGTLVAALIPFVIFSQREQIREAVKEHRSEGRTPVKVGVELYGLDEPLTEVAITENISRHGARVVTQNRWRPKDRLIVILPRDDESLRAQIAYCDALPGDVFAIGLRFASPVNMPNHRSAASPYRK